MHAPTDGWHRTGRCTLGSDTPTAGTTARHSLGDVPCAEAGLCYAATLLEAILAAAGDAAAQRRCGYTLQHQTARTRHAIEQSFAPPAELVHIVLQICSPS
jgi:hypothetical protein